MPDKVTSADVARRAGVSRSAVSRVFTQGASASPATAQKVREAAAELGYRPNSLARGLLTGRTRVIGIVVAYLDNQFYPQALERLCHALADQGYHALVFMTANSRSDVAHVVQGILDHQVDGLILASVSLSSELAQHCAQNNVPVVLFNRRQAGDSACAVVSDNFAGGQIAARHLLSRGCRRIAYIAGWAEASTQQEREAGFRSALAEGGHSLAARAVGDFNDGAAHRACLEIFDSATRPDAVFVANDHMALTVMDTLRFELGLRVPDDVAVIGFDDVPAAGWSSYRLTTLRQDTDAMVSHTVQNILHMIESRQTAPSELVPVSLVVRDSA